MLIEKIPVTWGKAEYVPFTIDGTMLNAGKGENTVSLDLEEAQSDTAVTIDIMQDYDGTLSMDKGILSVMTIAIPPAREKLVETGETNDKGESAYKVEKVPVDVENIHFTLYPMQYALEETKGEI